MLKLVMMLFMSTEMKEIMIMTSRGTMMMNWTIPYCTVALPASVQNVMAHNPLSVAKDGIAF